MRFTPRMPYRFRITHLHTEPTATFTYRNVSSRGVLERETWPVHAGQAVGLPGDLDALLLISDLQGHADPKLNGGRPGQLVGEYFPEFYLEHYRAHAWPGPEKVGVVLAGDLFALPDRRGGLGETRAVWRAMSQTFRWCVGVLGNHDLVDGKDSASIRGPLMERCWLLDGGTFEEGGLVIGGVGGVIGRSGRANRRPEDIYCQRLIEAVTDETDLIVIHEAPDVGAGGGRCNRIITDALNDLGWAGTVVCGHSKWQTWYHPSDDGFSVLNTEGRAVLLTRA